MTTSTNANLESPRKDDLHNWITQKYTEKHLAKLKNQHDAVWVAAEPAFKEDLRETCDYLIKQQEKTKATKVYITYALQCQANVILGNEQFPRSYAAFEGKTLEYPTFEEAWAHFENFVKDIYTPNITDVSEDWQNVVYSTFDHPVHGNGKFPFESKMPDWFYDNKDYKYDCYIEYETHIVGVN